MHVRNERPQGIGAEHFSEPSQRRGEKWPCLSVLLPVHPAEMEKVIWPSGDLHRQEPEGLQGGDYSVNS